MADAIVNSPLSLGELETVLEARKLRLAESLRAPRAALLQRLGHRLYDLQFAADLTDLQGYERSRLATISEARREIEEAKQLAAGYERGLTAATTTMQEAKAEYERCDSLTGATAKAKAIERYHLAKIESEVFQEAVEAIHVGVTEAERGLTRRVQSLEPEFDAYLTAKVRGIVKEATDIIGRAEGELRRATELKQRAAAFPREFRAAYGLEQEGHNGITKA